MLVSWIESAFSLAGLGTRITADNTRRDVENNTSSCTRLEVSEPGILSQYWRLRSLLQVHEMQFATSKCMIGQLNDTHTYILEEQLVILVRTQPLNNKTHFE